MADIIFNKGEEFENYVLFDGLSMVATVAVGLYYNTTDTLVETNDLANITTEPNIVADLAAWVTATGYVVGNQVKHNDAAYECTGNHTSGASTEPGVGADWATVWNLVTMYARQTVNIPAHCTVGFSGGDWRTLFDDLTFEVEGNSEDVDAYFVVVEFQASGDGAPTDHLYFAGSLDKTYDLDLINEYRLEDTGISRGD